MHGHGGDSGGVGAYAESGCGDGRRQRWMTEITTIGKTGWHDNIWSLSCQIGRAHV